MTKPKKSPKQGKEALAYHEAGHAVAYFELGAKIRKVTIRPTKDYAGCCFSYALFDSLSYCIGATPTIMKQDTQ
jgi:ATP-dependent Zn protease